MSVRPRMLAAVVLACVLVGASGTALMFRATHDHRAGLGRVAAARGVMLEQAVGLERLRLLLAPVAAARLTQGRHRVDIALAAARAAASDRELDMLAAREQRFADLWFAAAGLRIAGRDGS